MTPGQAMTNAAKSAGTPQNPPAHTGGVAQGGVAQPGERHDNSGQASHPQIIMSPGMVTQNLSLVIDVVCRDEDRAVAQFERVLRGAGVTFDAEFPSRKSWKGRCWPAATSRGNDSQPSGVLHGGLCVFPSQCHRSSMAATEGRPAGFCARGNGPCLRPADTSLFTRLRKLSGAKTTLGTSTWIWPIGWKCPPGSSPVPWSPVRRSRKAESGQRPSTRRATASHR